MLYHRYQVSGTGYHRTRYHKYQVPGVTDIRCKVSHVPGARYQVSGVTGTRCHMYQVLGITGIEYQLSQVPGTMQLVPYWYQHSSGKANTSQKERKIKSMLHNIIVSINLHDILNLNVSHSRKETKQEKEKTKN